MKPLNLLALAAATMLTACASQAPAPLSTRYDTRAVYDVASGSSGRMTDRVSAKAAQARGGVQQTFTTTPRLGNARVASEDLMHVEPAAGPVQGRQIASLPNRTASRAPAVPTNVPLQSYTVQAGDTVYSLSRRYNTTPSAIVQANNMESTAVLEPGMVLLIPSGSGRLVESPELNTGLPFGSPTPTAAKAPVKEVLDVYDTEPAAGPVTAPEKGGVMKGPSGQRYRMINQNERTKADVAAASAPAEPVQLHTVKTGDTIYRIAKTYGSSVIDIMAANDFAAPQDLKLGTQVRVPLKTADVTAAVASSSVSSGLPPEARNTSAKTTKVETALEETRRLMQAGSTSSEPPLVEAAPAAIKTVQQPAVQVAEVEADEAVVDVSKTRIQKPNRAELGKRGQVDKVAARERGLAWPVQGGKVIRRFGEQGNGVAHTGINIAVPANTPVVAAESGTVLYADNGLKTYGSLVLIRHDNGMVTAYAHNNALLVNKGDRVKKGQYVALSGNSGNVDKPQLHFEIRRNAQAVDPLRVLAGR